MPLSAPVRPRSSKTSYLSDPQVALMLRVRRDEPGAFAELAACHGPRIFSRFYRSFRDRQEAEDLTQEVLLRVYRSRKRYEPRAKFGTWLFHITQNVARNAFRDRRRQVSPALAQGRLEQGYFNRPEAELVSPAFALERLERARAVRAAVSGLAGHQRAALEMHQFQNRSYAEIAADLALTTKAIKSLLYRARLQLRGFLARLRDG
jgi:RNA polymerase sigma-70 factor, ECF subfamily